MKKFVLLCLILPFAIATAFESEEISYIFSPGSHETSGSDNASLVQSFYEAFEKNNASLLQGTLSDGYKVNTIAQIHQLASAQFDSGSKDLTIKMEAYSNAFPNLSVKIEQLIASDNKVVAQVSMTGIQKGTFFGIAPTNRYITVHTIAIFTIANGKITQIDEMTSEYNLMRQLGYIAI
ncbi:MAG: ester cyclase [Rhabdochlamydiaceae bacterium]|nr:ester cyclase [Candidatus Amphrikana amoebophyrae]